MKRTILLVIATLIFLLACSANVMAQEVKVFVQEEQVVFDVPPIEEKGRLLVPVRAIFEALGAEVTWDNSTQTVHARTDKIYVDITVNDTIANINGFMEELDVPARIVNGRVMVPLRFSGQALGAVVDWDGSNYTVNISYREPLNIDVKDISTVFSEYLTNLQFHQIEKNKFWITYLNDFDIDSSTPDNLENVISYYDKTSDESKILQRFVGGYQIENEALLSDGRLLVVLDDFSNDKLLIYVFDYRDNSVKATGVIPQKSTKIYTVISSQGEVLYYESMPVENPPPVDLWKIDLDGKVTRLTNTPSINEFEPKWSPDGKKIVYREFTKDGKNQRVSIMNSDGVNSHMVFDSVWAGYEWSPDSKSIALNEVGRDPFSIWVISEDGQDKKLVLTCDNTPQYQVWSPDGKKIAVQLFGHIAVVSSDGTGSPQYYGGSTPVWSPDSKLLLYNGYEGMSISDPEQNKSIVLLNGGAYDFTWSPDQREFYFESDGLMYDISLNSK